MVTVTAIISNYELLLVLHTSISELSVLRNTYLDGAVYKFRVAQKQSLRFSNRQVFFFFFLVFSIVLFLFIFFFPFFC